MGLDIYPPAPGGLDFGEGRADLGQQVRNEEQHESGRRAASSVGLTIGMSVPGIRRPCLAGDASTTAGSSVRSTWPGAAVQPRAMRHRTR